MEEVETFLKKLGLGEYVALCENYGYDHMECILEHDDEDLDIMGTFLGMLPGHLFVLKQAVKDANRARTNMLTGTYQVPIIPLNGALTQNVPAAAAAREPIVVAAAAAAAAVPTVTDTSSGKRKAQGNILPTFCKTRAAVRVESLRHSTALGHSLCNER